MRLRAICGVRVEPTLSGVIFASLAADNAAFFSLR